MAKRFAGGRVDAGITSADVLKQSSPSATQHGGEGVQRDWVVVEEPLQIRVAGDVLGVTLRTPGHDHELAAGFLLAEGLITSRDELGAIRHCGPQTSQQNSIDVLPGPGCVIEWPAQAQLPRRLASSACGLCGRQQIDDLIARLGRVDAPLRVEAATVQRATQGLRDGQLNFSKTGGCHAAGAATASGDYHVIREDVGRHNAVDKVVGRLLLDGKLPAHELMLLVSGRVGFEIVQKAVSAQFPIVVGVSAPTSLAIATAERARLTLVGFSRDDSFNVYSGSERIL